MLNVIPYPDYPTNTLRVGDGFVLLDALGCDMNSLDTITLSIDLAALAAAHGRFQAASLQVVKESGSTFATVVTALRVSNDGRNWKTRTGASVTGEGQAVDIDVTGVRFVRGEVTTVEGGAATGGIYICLTRDTDR